ncbi:hypothetical protein [Chishuiella changwenlii]|uniref:hypothetical protein n=1 Tax=Chishuiella changwenlii TaxID=1434701 RepID=UPI002FDAB29B
MKHIYILFNLCLSTLVLSQVGINTQAPKVSLDIDVRRVSSALDNTQLLGFQPPRLTLQELTNNTFVYGVNQKGAIIYITGVAGGTATGPRININEEGIYYFDGSVWKKMMSSQSGQINISSIVDPNILGYIPSSTATASTAAVPAISGVTITKVATGTFSGNGHTYAVYQTSANVTWYQAYYAAKSLGGYLATFTTDAEWQYVETSLITPLTVFDTNGGWIGFAKYSWNAGTALVPNPEMKWITGEQPNHNYAAQGTASVAKLNWFATNEPNNSGGTEGFVHFYHKNSNQTVVRGGYTSTHPWNDIPAAGSSSNPIRGFIVEFQQ